MIEKLKVKRSLLVFASFEKCCIRLLNISTCVDHMARCEKLWSANELTTLFTILQLIFCSRIFFPFSQIAHLISSWWMDVCTTSTVVACNVICRDKTVLKLEKEKSEIRKAVRDQGCRASQHEKHQLWWPMLCLDLAILENRLWLMANKTAVLCRVFLSEAGKKRDFLRLQFFGRFFFCTSFLYSFLGNYLLW